ncbi:unnamed protein product, partial [Staurois parvus]
MVLLQPAYVVAAAPLHGTLTGRSLTRFLRGGADRLRLLAVIGRLCAFPELQFWHPITGEEIGRQEAEPSGH